jgi:hypothetical protein
MVDWADVLREASTRFFDANWPGMGVKRQSPLLSAASQAGGYA